MMNTNKEEQQLGRRILDLAKTAENRGICLYSDFLNLNEQNIFYSLKKQLPKMDYIMSGGFADAERKMICFNGMETIGFDANNSFPISCISVEPLNKKFSDHLTHRDFLGAILNLGIERSKIGDIIIEENQGYVFCKDTIHSFIEENLIKIKHTMVHSSAIDQRDFHYTPNFKEIRGTVSSIRLDSILSVAFNSSRSSLTGFIAGGKVFVNSKVVLSNSYTLNEDDVISVRGYGKFIYKGTTNLTKKGRYSVHLLLYQ